MIEDLKLYSILNSRGNPAIRVDLITTNGIYSASSPSSSGRIYEAKELPLKKVGEIFPTIRAKIIGMNEADWVSVDRTLLELDQTHDFSKIGSNLSTPISVASARAATNNNLWKLGKSDKFPYQLSNVVAGQNWKGFLFTPEMAKSPQHGAEMLIEVHSVIGEEMKNRGLLAGMKDNAWKADLDDVKVLDFLSPIAEDWNMKIGVDFAASNIWGGGSYNNPGTTSKDKHIDFIVNIAESYDLFYLEDPLHQDDFGGFAELKSKLGDRMIVGDDLYSTNPIRLNTGIVVGSTNGIIIKPNQIGTLSQARNVVRSAQKNNIVPIISHRSIETDDDWIADLSVAWDIPMIKIGVMGSDTSKTNRLIQIWNRLDEKEMSHYKALNTWNQ